MKINIKVFTFLLLCSENGHFLNTFYFLEIREISFKFLCSLKVIITIDIQLYTYQYEVMHNLY